MKYAYWYVGIGVIFFIVMYLQNRFFGKQNTESIGPLFEPLNYKGKPFYEVVVDTVVIPCLGIMVVVAAWPFLVFMRLKEILAGDKSAIREEEQKFTVEPEHLQELLTIQEIEDREMVQDPLGAVPNLPFGHLNTAWRKFLSALEPEDTIWSFTAQWTSSWGSKQLMSGYVIKRADAIGPHFLTEWILPKE